MRMLGCVCVCVRVRAPARARTYPFQLSKHLSKFYKTLYASGAASLLFFTIHLIENYKHNNLFIL